jgi:hypothetical protein
VVVLFALSDTESIRDDIEKWHFRKADLLRPVPIAYMK